MSKSRRTVRAFSSPGGADPSRLDPILGGLQQDAPEVVCHERGDGRQELVERLHHLRGRGCVVAGRVADRLRTCSSNRSTARAASSRSARSASRASDSRSPSGRPNSSRCSAVRTSSMSPVVYRVCPPTSRPMRIPSRSTAWINDAGTPLASANPSRVSRSASSPASSRASAIAAARSASASPSSPCTTRPIASSVSPFFWSSRIRRMRAACTSPYQATRPSRSGCGSSPRDW